jgi:hypothetical protein
MLRIDVVAPEVSGLEEMLIAIDDCSHSDHTRTEPDNDGTLTNWLPKPVADDGFHQPVREWGRAALVAGTVIGSGARSSVVRAGDS